MQPSNQLSVLLVGLILLLRIFGCKSAAEKERQQQRAAERQQKAENKAEDGGHLNFEVKKMAISWERSVKDSKKLTVYNQLTGGKWVNLYNAALQLFNDLKLPVRMTKAKDKDGANVIMEVSSGMATHECGGTSQSRAFSPHCTGAQCFFTPLVGSKRRQFSFQPLRVQVPIS